MNQFLATCPDNQVLFSVTLRDGERGAHFACPNCHSTHYVSRQTAIPKRRSANGEWDSSWDQWGAQ